MSTPFFAGVGGVVSADIAVPEHDREQAFYASVLATGTSPLWQEDLLNDRGMPIVGLGARSPEHEHLPLQWMPHLQVADVGASVARALALGGEELLHGRDDAGASQWAVLLDPQGAAFGLIPVIPADALTSGDGDAEDSAEGSGRIARLDLAVEEAAPIGEFYRDVIGWSLRPFEMEDEGGAYTDYVLLGAEGRPAANLVHARGANRGLPPVWRISLPVGDLEESLRRVRQGGGEVLGVTQGSDGAVLSAVVRDPVGVCFGLVRG